MPWFWKKGRDCIHLWIEFSVQNVDLRVSRRNNSKILPGGAFVFLCFWLNVYRSVLIPQNLFLLGKFLVARLGRASKKSPLWTAFLRFYNSVKRHCRVVKPFLVCRSKNYFPMFCVVTTVKSSLFLSLYLAWKARILRWFLHFAMAYKVGSSIFCTIGWKFEQWEILTFCTSFEKKAVQYFHSLHFSFEMFNTSTVFISVLRCFFVAYIPFYFLESYFSKIYSVVSTFSLLLWKDHTS